MSWLSAAESSQYQIPPAMHAICTLHVHGLWLSHMACIATVTLVLDLCWSSQRQIAMFDQLSEALAAQLPGQRVEESHAH